MDDIDNNTLVCKFENGWFIKKELYEQMMEELEELREFKARLIMAVLEVDDDKVC